jgi:hypothetical protein
MVLDQPLLVHDMGETVSHATTTMTFKRHGCSRLPIKNYGLLPAKA